MDHLTALPPELITRIVDFVSDTADEAQRKADLRAMRGVSQKLSQCSWDAMLTACFHHVRVLYTYSALQSLIEVLKLPGVLRKIHKITIAIVSPKWSDCPPVIPNDTILASLEHVDYDQTYYDVLKSLEIARKSADVQLLEALDTAFRYLQASGNHADLGIIFCDVEKDSGHDGASCRSGTLLSDLELGHYIGGHKLLRLRTQYREHNTHFDISVLQPPTVPQLVSLSLRMLARTKYEASSLDLDFIECEGFRLAEAALTLPSSLPYPAWPRLISLSLRLDHADVSNIVIMESGQLPTCNLGNWLLHTRALRSLSLRFSSNNHVLHNGDQYVKSLTALTHSIRHNQLQTLVLDRFRFTTSAVTQLLASQAPTLQGFALLRPMLDGYDGFCSLFAWLGAKLTLTDFVFFDVDEVDHLPASETLGSEHCPERRQAMATFEPPCWRRRGLEEVRVGLEAYGRGDWATCDCKESGTGVCLMWPCAVVRDVRAWQDFEPIKWSGVRVREELDRVY